MNKINVLDNNNNSMLVSIRQRCRTAKQAYIRVRLVILKQVYHISQSAETPKTNKDAITLVCNYLLYWRSILV